MHFVVISVICSVTVSVIIKLARRYNINIVQMIAWNYPAAVLFTFFFFKPSIEMDAIQIENWGLFLLLGCLLPGVFLALAASIRHTGIVRTEIAQRISIVIPLAAAFFLFREDPSIQAIIGIAVGLLAIIFSFNWKEDKRKTISIGTWIYPLLIFFGMGIIDVLFKQVAQLKTVPYTSSIFIIFILALTLSFIYIFYRIGTKKEKFSLGASLWGLSLGLFNFGNIIFYMKAHKAIPDNPSIVFTTMNIGVIAVGALIGVFLFKEKLTTLNKIALVLAMICIVIIAGNEFI